jgi:hypothetical protein
MSFLTQFPRLLLDSFAGIGHGHKQQAINMLLTYRATSPSTGFSRASIRFKRSLHFALEGLLFDPGQISMTRVLPPQLPWIRTNKAAAWLVSGTFLVDILWILAKSKPALLLLRWSFCLIWCLMCLHHVHSEISKGLAGLGATDATVGSLWRFVALSSKKVWDS